MDYNDHIGKRVEYIGCKGTVRYSGKLKHKPKSSRIDLESLWFGVEWDDPTRGNHNGIVEDTFYFACEWSDSKRAGSLIRGQKTYFGVDALEAFVTKYFKPEEAHMLLEHKEQLYDKLNAIKEEGQKEKLSEKNQLSEYDEEAIIKTSISYKKIEFLGFQNIWKKMRDLNTLKNLSLSGYRVASLGKPGQLGSVFTTLKELSLEDSLISSWGQIEQLALELPNLETLWLSKNRLQIPNFQNGAEDKENSPDQLNYRPVFKNLTTVILSEMNLTWKEFSKIKYLFPNLRELGLAENRLNDTDNLDLTISDFPYLSKLDLSCNEISKSAGLGKFSELNLKKLNLYGNRLPDISIGDHFPLLTHLNASKNDLMTFDVLGHLSKFKSLEALRITDNPFLSFGDKVHCRLLIIGSVRKLKILNGSDLKRDEKKDAEIYYLKNAFHEYFRTSHTTAFTYDLDLFYKWARPLYSLIDELIKKFDNPYPVEERFYQEAIVPNRIDRDDRPIKKDPMMNFSASFCLITFWQIVDGKEVRLLLKKLPKNVDIGYLKTFLKNTLKLKSKVQSMKINNGSSTTELDNDLKRISDYAPHDNTLKIIVTL